MDLLLIGYGNPGRLDDGLGPLLAEAVENLNLPGVTVDSDYQLIVDDAAEVAKHETVLFVDASINGAEPFFVKRVFPAGGKISFSSHSVSPEGVLTLAAELFQAEPEAFVLGIRGYEFDEFGERLSEKAKANLAKAIEYVESAAGCGKIEEVRPADDGRT